MHGALAFNDRWSPNQSSAHRYYHCHASLYKHSLIYIVRLGNPHTSYDEPSSILDLQVAEMPALLYSSVQSC